MAITALSVNAKEGSTYIITVVFSDDGGITIIPVSATWSLRDSNGNIVNNRSNVAFSSLATTVSVVLSGADLNYSPIIDKIRTFTVVGTYNSTYGNGLPFADECTFNIESLVGVADV